MFVSGASTRRPAAMRWAQCVCRRSWKRITGSPAARARRWKLLDFAMALGDGGTKGVFVETNKADFNRLFALLAGPH